MLFSMNTLAILLFSAGVLFGSNAQAIEEDLAHHGPLDGHAVKVFGIIKHMKLSDEALAKCRKVAEESQQEWRTWFAKNRDKVERLQKKLDQLRSEQNRAELKKAMAEKKSFMHTAPSLLRNPEPLKAVLSAEEYTAFAAKLEALKKSLHDPKKE